MSTIKDIHYDRQNIESPLWCMDRIPNLRETPIVNECIGRRFPSERSPSISWEGTLFVSTPEVLHCLHVSLRTFVF